MNIHRLVDRATVEATALILGKRKFFRESLEIPSFQKFLQSTRIHLPEIKGERFYEVFAETEIGELKAGIYLAQWKGESYPTLIYHHGSMEQPYDYSFFSINTFKWFLFSKRKNIRANLVSVCAPFLYSIGEYLRRVNRVSNLLAMLSVSVKMVEDLVKYLRRKQKTKIAVAGISLGGIVANLHRTYYNSADIYIPLLSGPRVGDIFIRSFYKRVVSEKARDQIEVLGRTLNFNGDFKKIKTFNVFPLLALYDEIFQWEEQKSAYEAFQLTSIPRGHITAALDKKRIRRHILRCLKELDESQLSEEGARKDP